MDLRPLEFLAFFQCGDRLETSKSDVCRRQILTSKVGPVHKVAHPTKILKIKIILVYLSFLISTGKAKMLSNENEINLK